MAPPPPAEVPEAERLRRLAELQRRLTGTRLSEDFTNGVPDALLLRYLAARSYDVDKALTVRRLGRGECARGPGAVARAVCPFKGAH